MYEDNENLVKNNFDPMFSTNNSSRNFTTVRIINVFNENSSESEYESEYESDSDSDTDICTLCYIGFEETDRTITYRCNDKFHFNCYQDYVETNQWKTRFCPNCGRGLTAIGEEQLETERSRIA